MWNKYVIEKYVHEKRKYFFYEKQRDDIMKNSSKTISHSRTVTLQSSNFILTVAISGLVYRRATDSVNPHPSCNRVPIGPTSSPEVQKNKPY